MVDNSRRDRVGLGLIGLGPSWEHQYRDALTRLGNRLRIRLVYDTVEARARSVAGELGADVAGSLRQVLTRHSLQGLLVLDPGWCGTGILSLIARSGKPAYLAHPLLRLDSTLRDALNGSANGSPSTDSQKADHQLMPELSLRFTPASCRLRELIATKLGDVRRIMIDCDLSNGRYELASLVDWCTHVMGHAPTRAGRVTTGDSRLIGIELDFPQQTESSKTSIASRCAILKHHVSNERAARIDVECERGHATLISRSRVVWRSSSESGDESLADERTEFEILIDQFCRRALGGLNPVGRLSEFARAMELVKSIQNEIA